jgi:hypothetical protein
VTVTEHATQPPTRPRQDPDGAPAQHGGHTDPLDGLTAESVYGGEVPEDFAGADPWTVTLRRDGRTLAVPYYTGPGLRDRMADGPSAEDVLDCLLSDASTVESVSTFEEWCAELGYDEDSRRAERTYEAIKAQTVRLRAFLGDACVGDLVEPDRPALGATVQLSDRVNIGARFRTGTVVGYGTVHPDRFPIPADLPAYPVVLVVGPDGTADAWNLDRIATAEQLPSERAR